MNQAGTHQKQVVSVFPVTAPLEETSETRTHGATQHSHHRCIVRVETLQTQQPCHTLNKNDNCHSIAHEVGKANSQTWTVKRCVPAAILVKPHKTNK